MGVMLTKFYSLTRSNGKKGVFPFNIRLFHSFVVTTLTEFTIAGQT